jgi:hyperosmotically inducible protein
METLKNKTIALAALAILIATPTLVLASNNPVQKPLEERVRHELAMLPYLSVFDDLSFRLENGTVTLFGEVTRPVLKSDAAGVVKHVEGVTRVDNQIEVLPLSPMDNQIRMREYRAIFGYGPLQRYRMGAIPSIHIVVKNGNVTLKGFVSSDMDKQLAYVRANGVSGVFAVDNQIQVSR